MGTFTYEELKYRFKNPTVDGNLHLLADSSILKIGADSDIQLTHSGTAGTMTILNGFTIDIVEDLVIDVDGGDVVFKDGGTQFGKLTGSNNELIITSGDDVMLTGADGGAATFAATLAVTGVLTADAGVEIDAITIDGTTIALSAGSLSINATEADADITLDAARDIVLDADGGDIFLKDGGTTFGEFTNSSTDFVIKSTTSDKDIIFKGNDGGTAITALTLDMSAAGAATFNNIVSATEVQISGTNILSKVYPVGSIFTAVVSTNPATLLGIGVWAAFGAGKMLVGFDGSDSDFDDVEGTGGAKTHQLTIAEMPAHDHPRGSNSNGAGFTDDAGTGGLQGYMGGDQTFGTFDARLTSQGGDDAHNNMPPFITVYMWKRTS